MRPGFDPWVGKSPGEGNTPVFWPGEFHGKRRLKGNYSSWGHKESDTTEKLILSHFRFSASIPASDTYEVKLIRMNHECTLSHPEHSQQTNFFSSPVFLNEGIDF